MTDLNQRGGDAGERINSAMEKHECAVRASNEAKAQRSRSIVEKAMTASDQTHREEVARVGDWSFDALHSPKIAAPCCTARGCWTRAGMFPGGSRGASWACGTAWPWTRNAGVQPSTACCGAGSAYEQRVGNGHE